MEYVLLLVAVLTLLAAAAVVPEVRRGMRGLFRSKPGQAPGADPAPSAGEGVAGADYPSGAISIAVVVRGQDVLMVHRQDERERLSWLFPSGQMNDGETAEHRAVREVYQETAVNCRAERVLSERRHPDTDKYCIYVQCTYLGGEAANRDPEENRQVAWVPARDVARHVTTDLYGEVQAFLDTLSPSNRGDADVGTGTGGPLPR